MQHFSRHSDWKFSESKPTISFYMLQYIRGYLYIIFSWNFLAFKKTHRHIHTCTHTNTSANYYTHVHVWYLGWRIKAHNHLVYVSVYVYLYIKRHYCIIWFNIFWIAFLLAYEKLLNYYQCKYLYNYNSTLYCAYSIKSQYQYDLIFILLPETEAEDNGKNITWVEVIWLASILLYSSICNQLPVVKPSGSAALYSYSIW